MHTVNKACYIPLDITDVYTLVYTGEHTSYVQLRVMQWCGGVYFTERNGNGTHVPEVNVSSYISKAIASRHS